MKPITRTGRYSGFGTRGIVIVVEIHVSLSLFAREDRHTYAEMLVVKVFIESSNLDQIVIPVLAKKETELKHDKRLSEHTAALRKQIYQFPLTAQLQSSKTIKRYDKPGFAEAKLYESQTASFPSAERALLKNRTGSFN